MNTGHLVIAGPLFVLLVAGCSAGTTPAASEPDVASYEAALSKLQSAVKDYRGMMSSSTAGDSASCHPMASQYDSVVRPILASSLMPGAGPMDSWMDDHGGAAGADMACVAAAMMTELDHHRMMACMSADPAANRAEAMRHTEGMDYYAGQMSARCADVMSSGEMHGSMMHGGSMMPGCADWPDKSPGPWEGGSCDAGWMGCCDGGWMGGMMGCCSGGMMGCH